MASVNGNNAKNSGSRSKTRRMLLDSMRALIADTAAISSEALVYRRYDECSISALQTPPSEVVGSSYITHSVPLSSSSPPAPTAIMVDTFENQKDLGTVFQQEGVTGSENFVCETIPHSPLPFTLGPYTSGFESSLPEDLLALPGCDTDGQESINMEIFQLGMPDVDWTTLTHDNSGEGKMQDSACESHHTTQSSHTASTADHNARSRSAHQPRLTASRRLQRRATDESRSSSSRSTNNSKPYRAHSAIERKYRAALQDRFQALRDVVAQWRQEEMDSGTEDWDDGSVKLNKSGVLAEAVECINQLKEENDLLFEQLGAIMDTVKQLRTNESF